jgi:hypothetical protein
LKKEREMKSRECRNVAEFKFWIKNVVAGRIVRTEKLTIYYI